MSKGLMLAGAVVLAAIVGLSVVAEASDLHAGAWWAPVAILVLPAYLAVAYVREERPDIWRRIRRR